MDNSNQIRSVLEKGRFELLETSYQYFSIQNCNIQEIYDSILPFLTSESFIVYGIDNLTLILPSISSKEFLDEVVDKFELDLVFQTSVALFVASFPSEAIDVPGLIVAIYEGLAKRTLSLVCTFTLHTTAYYVVHEEDRDEFIEVFYIILGDIRDRFST